MPVVVDRKGAQDASVGDLVLVRARSGPGATSSACSAARPTSRRCSKACSGTRESRRPAPPLPEEPGDEEPDRVDLRELVSFTIDPETAKDFDDALASGAEGDGIRAWVHIADVSRYVPAGHAARPRRRRARASRSTCPDASSRCSRTRSPTDLCSLRPDVDRRCVTVEVPFDADLAPRRAALLPQP